MTSTLTAEQFFTPDYPEVQIDQFGTARLRDRARSMGMVLTGDVTRTHDALMVATPSTAPGGEATISYTEAEPGDADPAGRLVRWEVDIAPAATGEATVLTGQVFGDDRLSRAMAPAEVTVAGGLVGFRHQLAGPVTVRAYDETNAEVSYAWCSEIDDNEVEILLPSGVRRLEAVRDDPDGSAAS